MSTPNALPPMLKNQQGFSFLSLVFWAALISFIAMIVVRTVPAITEYRTLLSMVDKVAKEGGSTVPEIQAAFTRSKASQYGVESISAKDLDISKENDQIQVGFAYDKEIEILGPVSLLIHFKGESR